MLSSGVWYALCGSVETEDCHAFSNNFWLMCQVTHAGKMSLLPCRDYNCGSHKAGKYFASQNFAQCLGPGNCPLRYPLSLCNWESSPSSLFNHMLCSKPSAPQELEIKSRSVLMDWGQIYYSSYLADLSHSTSDFPKERFCIWLTAFFWVSEIPMLSTQGKKFHVSAT